MNGIWILHKGLVESFLDHSSLEIRDYLQSFGVEATAICYNSIKFKMVNGKEVLYFKNEPLKSLPKVVFARGNCYKLMQYLSKNGVKVINDFLNMVYMKDKWQTYLILQKLGVNQPKTLNYKHETSFEEIENILGLPFVVKYRFGAQGNSVFLINSKEEYLQTVSKYYFDDLILQEYIKTSFGKDVRVFVVGEKLFGVIRDNTNNGDFRANLAQGGISYKFEIPNDLKETIKKIIKEFKCEIVGLDFLFDKNGMYSFCEANGNAGYKAFTNQGIDMSKIIAEYIFDTYFKEI